MRFRDSTSPEARARLLGERLAAERLSANLSQQEAASRAGLSRDAVQRAEQGRGTVDTLLRLLATYGIDDRLDLLLPEAEPSPVEMLNAERVPRRQRARRRARRTGDAPSIWPDDR